MTRPPGYDPDLDGDPWWEALAARVPGAGGIVGAILARAVARQPGASFADYAH